MQTISGVHYNLSFPDTLFAELQAHETDEQLKSLSLQDYRSHRYFGLIRNFIRFNTIGHVLGGRKPNSLSLFLDRTQTSFVAFNQRFILFTVCYSTPYGAIGLSKLSTKKA